MLGVQQNVGWDKDESIGKNLSRMWRGLFKPGVMKSALPLGIQLYLGVKPKPPTIRNVQASLSQPARKLATLIRDHSHAFKLASKRFADQIVSRQCVQALLADSAMWLHAWACTLSKLDHDARVNSRDPDFERRWTAAHHFFDLAEMEIQRCFHDLKQDDDGHMIRSAKAAMQYAVTLPNSDYMIHEASPNAKGTGKAPARTGIRQFPGDNAASDNHDVNDSKETERNAPQDDLSRRHRASVDPR
jgi:acyl-CoA dehydrogenase family protein 9